MGYIGGISSAHGIDCDVVNLRTLCIRHFLAVLTIICEAQLLVRVGLLPIGSNGKSHIVQDSFFFHFQTYCLMLDLINYLVIYL